MEQHGKTKKRWMRTGRWLPALEFSFPWHEVSGRGTDLVKAQLTLEDGKGEIQYNKKQTDSPCSVYRSSRIWGTRGEHLIEESLVLSTWCIDAHTRHLLIRHVYTWFDDRFIQLNFNSLRFVLAAKDSRLPLSSKLMIVVVMVFFDYFKLDRINLFERRSCLRRI